MFAKNAMAWWITASGFVLTAAMRLEVGVNVLPER